MPFRSIDDGGYRFFVGSISGGKGSLGRSSGGDATSIADGHHWSFLQRGFIYLRQVSSHEWSNEDLTGPDRLEKPLAKSSAYVDYVIELRIWNALSDRFHGHGR